MKISVYGSGYVGLVTAACLAESGNQVVCMDIDAAKIERLRRGEIPIYEPELKPLVERNAGAGRLQFTSDAAEAVRHGLFQFICVGTPSDEDGSADIRHVLDVARTIGSELTEYRILVTKSTSPVGTSDRVRAVVAEALAARGLALDFDVVSNPEFLKEGAAVKDFMKPDRIVVGTDNPRTAELLKMLYEPFNRNHDRVLVMDVRSAELTKYAANAMLATKISFMNEMACLAEQFGADIEQVRTGIGSDPRIGYHFIYAGAGFGGSCFPKDVRALKQSARDAGFTARLIEAVEEVNRRQKELLFEKIRARFGGDVNGLTIALWGLAFKPNTDDMREASSRTLMEALWSHGAAVRAFDPQAMESTRRIYGERADLVLCARAEDALQGADALVVITEWQEFRSPDFEHIRDTMNHPIIFDGRNLYDPSLLERLGLECYGIGRGHVRGPHAVRQTGDGIQENVQQ